jgi:hypothetical protein
MSCVGFEDGVRWSLVSLVLRLMLLSGESHDEGSEGEFCCEDRFVRFAKFKYSGRRGPNQKVAVSVGCKRLNVPDMGVAAIEFPSRMTI